MAKRTNRINCLDRAMDVLEAFTRAGELGVSELARQLNTHVATIYNIVKTLTARQYLINLNGRYRLGPAAGQLAGALHAELPLPQLLDPVVGELSRTTGENAFVAVLHGIQARLIVSHRGKHDVTANDFQRIWLSPLDLATGRVLVAFAPESVWDNFIGSWHRQRAVPASDVPENLRYWRAEFRKIRDRRIAEILVKNRAAVSAVAAPVFDMQQRVVAAIGVSFPSLRLTRKHLDFIRAETTRAAAAATQICGGKTGIPVSSHDHSSEGA